MDRAHEHLKQRKFSEYEYLKERCYTFLRRLNIAPLPGERGLKLTNVLDI